MRSQRIQFTSELPLAYGQPRKSPVDLPLARLIAHADRVVFHIPFGRNECGCGWSVSARCSQLPGETSTAVHFCRKIDSSLSPGFRFGWICSCERAQ
jgi:hypothetical protein